MNSADTPTHLASKVVFRHLSRGLTLTLIGKECRFTTVINNRVINDNREDQDRIVAFDKNIVTPKKSLHKIREGARNHRNPSNNGKLLLRPSSENC